MSAEYLTFVSTYATLLTIASLIAFSERGQHLLLTGMQALGTRVGIGEWGLMRTFGFRADLTAIGPSDRAVLAESYIASARSQTLVAARVIVWVMISGCMFTALTGAVIAGVLPRYVESGAWSYDAYIVVSQALIRVNLAGGVVIGLALMAWLVARTMRLNRSEGCVAAREIALAAQADRLDPALVAEFADGGYPLLSGLIADVT